MAAPTGTATTYNLTTGVKLNVENAIWIITPTDVPLQGTMGADGRTALSSDTCFEKKIEWLDEVLLVPTGTLGAQITVSAATDIIVTTGGGALSFNVGDVVQIDNELVQVTAYSATTNDLVVTRGFGGTTAATHATTALVTGVGMALGEGSDAGAARSVDRTNRYNMTQIFGPIAVQVSGTENSVQKYGLTGTEFDKQVANRVKENAVAYEQALLYGTRYESTTTNVRTMGGLKYWIHDGGNEDTTTTVLTETALLASLKTCFDNGGSPDRIIVGSKQKQVISGFSGPASTVNSNSSMAIRYAQDTNIRGQVVDYYDSDFGRQTIVLDRWCTPNSLFVFERDQATMATLRPMTFEMLAKTGDSTKGQIVGEKSLWFRRPTWASQFTVLT